MDIVRDGLRERSSTAAMHGTGFRCDRTPVRSAILEQNCRELCPVYAFAIQKCSRNFGLERKIHVLWNIPGEPGDAHGVEFGRYNSDQVAARVN